jgi:hypothetical protein
MAGRTENQTKKFSIRFQKTHELVDALIESVQEQRDILTNSLKQPLTKHSITKKTLDEILVKEKKSFAELQKEVLGLNELAKRVRERVPDNRDKFKEAKIAQINREEFLKAKEKAKERKAKTILKAKEKAKEDFEHAKASKRKSLIELRKEQDAILAEPVTPPAPHSYMEEILTHGFVEEDVEMNSPEQDDEEEEEEWEEDENEHTRKQRRTQELGNQPTEIIINGGEEQARRSGGAQQ